MNNFMNALAKVMFKVGEFGFKTLWVAWFIPCTIVCVAAMMPASLMDMIGHNRRPWEKQFGIVGVAYVYVTCIVAPLKIVGYEKLRIQINGETTTIEGWYHSICKDYKNGL